MENNPAPNDLNTECSFRLGLTPHYHPVSPPLYISLLCSAQSWMLRAHAHHHILLINQCGLDKF